MQCYWYFGIPAAQGMVELQGGRLAPGSAVLLQEKVPIASTFPLEVWALCSAAFYCSER